MVGMAAPELLGLTPSNALAGLVADSRAIGVRVVLDLAAVVPSHHDDPLPVVVVPDSLAHLLDGFPTYGS